MKCRVAMATYAEMLREGVGVPKNVEQANRYENMASQGEYYDEEEEDFPMDGMSLGRRMFQYVQGFQSMCGRPIRPRRERDLRVEEIGSGQLGHDLVGLG
jgi:hypothetical protein